MTDLTSQIYNVLDNSFDLFEHPEGEIEYEGKNMALYSHDMKHFVPFDYIYNPIEILMVWQGGMSFHGGVLGVIGSTFIFCKKFKIDTFYFLDLISLAAPIGIFLGRIANFINSELYGRKSDFFLSVIFEKIDNFPRHPSQIYEAFFEGIILFILLNFIFKSFLNKSGVISALFLIFYSSFRFIIEYTREPDPHLGLQFLDLSQGQLISIIFLILGLTIFRLKNVKS